MKVEPDTPDTSLLQKETDIIMATKATHTAEQKAALTGIANDAMTLGEAESALTTRTFQQIVALYVKASIALWAAVRVFGGKDADKAGAESVGLVKAALRTQGKTWEPSDSQLSRFRTLRHHTEKRRQSYELWCLSPDGGDVKPPTLGDYVSYLGAISRKDRDEDGTLTDQGKRKTNKAKRERNKRNGAMLNDKFDVSTLYGDSATKAEKAAGILALIHDLNRELSALKVNKADMASARRKLTEKIDAALKA